MTAAQPRPVPRRWIAIVALLGVLALLSLGAAWLWPACAPCAGGRTSAIAWIGAACYGILGALAGVGGPRRVTIDAILAASATHAEDHLPG